MLSMGVDMSILVCCTLMLDYQQLLLLLMLKEFLILCFDVLSRLRNIFQCYWQNALLTSDSLGMMFCAVQQSIFYSIHVLNKDKHFLVRRT